MPRGSETRRPWVPPTLTCHGTIPIPNLIQLPVNGASGPEPREWVLLEHSRVVNGPDLALALAELQRAGGNVGACEVAVVDRAAGIIAVAIRAPQGEV